MHEDFSRTETIRGPSDRAFGLVFAALFLILGLASWLTDPSGAAKWWALGLAACLALCALLWTAPLAPLNRLWMALGLALFRVVNPIAMALIFYLTIFPMGLVIRLMGKDPLRLRRDKTAESYWIPRNPSGPSPESMKDQF